MAIWSLKNSLAIQCRAAPLRAPGFARASLAENGPRMRARPLRFLESQLISSFFKDHKSTVVEAIDSPERLLPDPEGEAQIEGPGVVVSNHFLAHLAAGPLKSSRPSHDGVDSLNAALGAV